MTICVGGAYSVCHFDRVLYKLSIYSFQACTSIYCRNIRGNITKPLKTHIFHGFVCEDNALEMKVSLTIIFQSCSLTVLFTNVYYDFNCRSV